MENKVLLNCFCLSDETNHYCVLDYYNFSPNHHGGWINTMDNLITILEERCFHGWKEKQIYIKITEDKDEKDIQFTMRVYDHLLKCGIDVLLWEGDLNGA